MTVSLVVLGKQGCGVEQDGNSACPSDAAPSLHAAAPEHCNALQKNRVEKVSIHLAWGFIPPCQI